jgi:hypothetical protein
MARTRAIDFNIDTSLFQKDFNKISDIVLNKAAITGVENAVKVFHNLADNEVPKTPELTGALRASAKEETRREAFGAIVGVLSYNTPYAAKWHEFPDGDEINWTLPGSGTKYMEAKMGTSKNKIMEPIAIEIKRVL